MTGTEWLAELDFTIRNPQAGAKRIIALQLPLGTAWTALILIAVLTAGLSYIGSASPNLPPDPLSDLLLASPLIAAALQVMVQAVSALLLWAVGRGFGGQGELPDAVALTAWLGVPLMALQAVQVVLVFLAPVLAVLLGLFGVGLTFWLLSHFACALHGFSSALRAFGVILATSFVVGIVFVVLLALSGFGGVLPHV